MRILFVGTHPGGGGTESHFVSLALAMAAAGHEVIAAVRPNEFIERSLRAASRIQIIPTEFRNRWDRRAIRDLINLVRRDRPEWIVGSFKAEYWALSIVSKMTGVPLVLFSHLDQSIRPIVLNRFSPLARAVIVPSNYLRSRSIERGLPASRVHVLRNPVDVDHFRPDVVLRARVRASLGLKRTDVLVGYAGRFEPQKGVSTLARALRTAMARDSRVHALWVGHGESEQELHDIVRSDPASNRHHWMPWLEDVHPAYAAMDLLALPSEGSETFGRVLVEAQACGVPVLGARNGGIPEALGDHETGRVIPAGEAEAWAMVIGEMADNGAARRRLAAAARAFAYTFRSSAVVDDFVRLLADLKSPAAPIPITTAPAVDRALKLVDKAAVD